jgi:hypothetical protein
MKKTFVTLSAILSMNLISAETYNAGGIAFTLTDWERGNPGKIQATSLTSGNILWSKTTGETSAIKIKPSPNGEFLAVLSGDKRRGLAFPALNGSQNTLYLLNGKTGNTIKSLAPLLGGDKTWAEEAWQNLSILFQGNNLILKGDLFTNPSHPNPVPWSYTLPLPIEKTKQAEKPAQEIKYSHEW